jgi:hypothetical protein
MPIFLFHWVYIAMRFRYNLKLTHLIAFLGWPIFLVIAVGINFRNSFSLFTKNSVSAVLRPVVWENEIVETSRIWRESESGNQFTVLVFILTFFGVYYLVSNRIKIDSENRILIYSSLVTIVVLTLLVFDIGSSFGIQWVYQKTFWQFRGVNYFWKFSTFLLIPLLATYLDKRKFQFLDVSSLKRSFFPDFPSKKRVVPSSVGSPTSKVILLSIFMVANLALSIPNKTTFSIRGDLANFEMGMAQLKSKLDNRLVLEIPNRLRGGDKGFPEGYIQLSQIVHGHPLLNGVPEIFSKQSIVMTPQDILTLKSLEQWVIIGVKYLIVRPKLLSGEEKTRWESFLSSNGRYIKLIGNDLGAGLGLDYLNVEVYEILVS